jgi:hypothetical protein
MNREALRLALLNTGVCLAAYLAGYYFTWGLQGSPSLIGALWAMISGIVVLQATRQETWVAAWLRVLGSLIGALISAAYPFASTLQRLGFGCLHRPYRVGVPASGHSRSRPPGRHYRGGGYGGVPARSGNKPADECRPALPGVRHRGGASGVGGPGLAGKQAR